MHFTKLVISTMIVALGSIAVAAPTPEANALDERSGWTCNFLGGEACQVKDQCVAEGKSGGYCNAEQVCTCH